MSRFDKKDATDIEDIRAYIEAYGSARLKNCFRQAMAEQRMPYSTLEEYFADSIETRLVKLKLIRNLGARTATEFNEIVERYVGSSSVIAKVAAADLSALAGTQSEDGSVLVAAQEMGTSENRYSNLSSQEIDVVRRRFGIGREAKQTLEEIGLEYDVTRERIRQIESKALRKMRSARIKQSWEIYVTENIERLIDAIFGAESIIEQPTRISGELALAVKIVFETASKFLEHKVQRFESYWVRPDLDVLEIQTARNRLAGCLRESSNLPISVNEAMGAIEVGGGVIAAAVSAIDKHRLYNGWIIRGNATSRKKRVVNILNLFHKGHIKSPVSLWQMKVAYWEHYEDKCSGRDLLICLQDHKSHFVNLRELGWVCLTVVPDEDAGDSDEHVPLGRPPDELYTKPVKTGHGLANCVYEMFESHGPLRLADAASIFEREYPKYKVSSMYPMLVYFAVFLRFAPGIIGIQAHRLDSDSLRSAREIMLRENDLDLFLLSRAAGPPELRYPLWDSEMEHTWASWLEEKQDEYRLGALLRVARLEEWNVSEPEREKWEIQKEKSNAHVSSPAMRIFSERRIDTGILTTALAAASIFGFVNWMYLNQALGWRVETTRVGLVLAVLIRIGVLKPTGAWSDPHVLTKVGRRISRSIFGRSILPASELRKTMTDFIVKPVESRTDIGWAREYDLEQLLNQITDISGKQNDVSSDAAEEGSDVQAAYEGFMGDELRKLIEGH